MWGCVRSLATVREPVLPGQRHGGDQLHRPGGHEGWRQRRAPTPAPHVCGIAAR